MIDTLKYLYGRMVLDILPDVVTDCCYGCETNHPSQVHHSCLMWTKLEHLDMYFHIAYRKINEKELINKMADQLMLMDIPSDLKPNNVRDWCLQYEPKTKDVLNLCRQFVALEYRFGDELN